MTISLLVQIVIEREVGLTDSEIWMKYLYLLRKVWREPDFRVVQFFKSSLSKA